MSKKPQERRREKNQNFIIDTATRLIVANGIENTSLREIAKHADYSPAGLYKYFDSKNAIIQAVQTRENQKLIEELKVVSQALSPTQQLIELCLVYIRFSVENHIHLILINSLASHRKNTDETVPSTSPYAFFLSGVKTWVESETLQLQPDYGVEEITYTLWSLIHGMATLRVSQLKNFEADFQAVNQQSIEILLDGLKSRLS